MSHGLVNTQAYDVCGHLKQLKLPQNKTTGWQEVQQLITSRGFHHVGCCGLGYWERGTGRLSRPVANATSVHYGTRGSQVIPQPSTNRAQPRLTSEF